MRFEFDDLGAGRQCLGWRGAGFIPAGSRCRGKQSERQNGEGIANHCGPQEVTLALFAGRIDNVANRLHPGMEGHSG